MTSRPHPEQPDRREAMTAMAVGAAMMLVGDAAAQEKNAVTHPAGSQHELKTLEEQLRERGVRVADRVEVRLASKERSPQQRSQERGHDCRPFQEPASSSRA